MGSLVGSNDDEVKRALLAEVDEAFHEDSDRAAARAWVERIVSGAITGAPPRVEDQTLQSVVVLLARHGQSVVDNTCWGFWEDLVVWCDRNAEAARTMHPTRRRMIGFLLHGRPYFGEAIASDWTYAALIPNALVDELIELAREPAIVVGSTEEATRRRTEKRDEAVRWLETMEQSGVDLLYCCS